MKDTQRDCQTFYLFIYFPIGNKLNNSQIKPPSGEDVEAVLDVLGRETGSDGVWGSLGLE